MRKVREIKKAEEVEHKKFVKMMYAFKWAAGGI